MLIAQIGDKQHIFTITMNEATSCRFHGTHTLLQLAATCTFHCVIFSFFAMKWSSNVPMRFQRGVDGEVQHAGRVCSDQGLRGTTVLAEVFCL